MDDPTLASTFRPEACTVDGSKGGDGEIQVFDVWESREAFDAFGVTLLPILAAAGVEMNEPMVARIHNEIKG